jgi:hypothetical protein
MGGKNTPLPAQLFVILHFIPKSTILHDTPHTRLAITDPASSRSLTTPLFTLKNPNQILSFNVNPVKCLTLKNAHSVTAAESRFVYIEMADQVTL